MTVNDRSDDLHEHTLQRTRAFRLTMMMAVAWVLLTPAVVSPAGMDFWSEPRGGANLVNRVETVERLAAARDYGISWIRLSPDRWAGVGRDFLVGDGDVFTGVVEADLEQLVAVIDVADSLGLRVVIALRSLPGARWADPHPRPEAGREGAADSAQGIEHASALPPASGRPQRLWLDDRCQKDAASVWRRVAERLRGHPAVVGYDVLSAPYPEAVADTAAGVDWAAWSAGVQGSPAELNRFYATVLAAIREVDADTPVILECGLEASPTGFIALRPVEDPNVLHSFQMYEPQEYTDRQRNRDQLRYPGRFFAGAGTPEGAREADWDREALLDLMSPVIRWQSSTRIASNRILVAEFGVHRQTPGASTYLADLIRCFDDIGWHRAFYAFREDAWAGMDYELGTEPLGASYWRALRRGEEPPLERVPNPLFDVIRSSLVP